MKCRCYTDKEVIEALKRHIKAAGNQDRFAREVGFTPSYVSDVVNEKKPLSDRMLDVLGFEWALKKKGAK